MSILEQGFETLARGLRDFGYPTACTENVRAAHEQWKRGEQPGDIIGMFAVKEFDERPEIFGTPD